MKNTNKYKLNIKTMKKGLLTLLAASLVFVGCQNYDDQFDDLNAQISALKSQVDGLSSLSGQVSALSGTIAGLQSGVAAAQASADAANTAAINEANLVADTIDAYFDRYTGVRDYMNNIKAKAKEDKFVETIMGRRLYLNEINAANGLRRQAAERAAINAPLQGSAADIIKKAMLDIDD